MLCLNYDNSLTNHLNFICIEAFVYHLPMMILVMGSRSNNYESELVSSRKGDDLTHLWRKLTSVSLTHLSCEVAYVFLTTQTCSSLTNSSSLLLLLPPIYTFLRIQPPISKARKSSESSEFDEAEQDRQVNF